MALPLLGSVVGSVAGKVVPKVVDKLIPGAREAAGEVKDKVVEKAGKKVVEKGLDTGLKKLLDDSVEALLGKKGTQAAQAAVEKVFTKGGGAFLEKALNFLKPDLGTGATDAISTLVKGGKFAELTNKQAVSLGKAFLEVAGVLI